MQGTCLFLQLLIACSFTKGYHYCYERKCTCDNNGTADCSNNLRFRFIPKLPPNITTLIFTLNELERIESKAFFKNVTQLTSLSLMGNLLAYIAPDAFGLLENLTSIDLSFNPLTSLPENVFNVKLRSRLLYLDLTDNAFRCECELVWLSRWIVSNASVFEDTIGYPYQCSDLWSAMRDVPDLSNLGLHGQVCINRDVSVPIICVCSAILIPFVFVLSLAVIDKSCCERSRPKHLSITVLPFRVYRGNSTERARLTCVTTATMRYDIFVAYAEEDRDLVFNHLVPFFEEKLGLKMCLHERDFHPGRNILENIEDAMGSSKKLMMIFSTHFAHSPWCQFELSMGQRLTMDRHDELVVVYVNSAPESQLTPGMVAILRTCTYIEWPGRAGGTAVVWGSLFAAVKDVVPQRRQRPQIQPRPSGQRPAAQHI